MELFSGVGEAGLYGLKEEMCFKNAGSEGGAPSSPRGSASLLTAFLHWGARAWGWGGLEAFLGSRKFKIDPSPSRKHFTFFWGYGVFCWGGGGVCWLSFNSFWKVTVLLFGNTLTPKHCLGSLTMGRAGGIEVMMQIFQTIVCGAFLAKASYQGQHVEA